MAAALESPTEPGCEKKKDRFGFIHEGAENDTYYYVELPVNVVRERERRWLAVLSNWDGWASRKPLKIQQLCRKGIPSSLRHQVWLHLCGAARARSQTATTYQELLSSECSDLDWKCIQLDSVRTFNNHEFFQSPQGRDDLCKVLKAFCVHRKEIGFMSGMSFLAATLLLVMPAEDAFWCLVQLLDHYVPEYFVTGRPGYKVDTCILEDFLRQYLPDVSSFLQAAHYDAQVFCCDWFIMLFTRTLPWSCVLRIWDMFLCEGSPVKFRVALALLKLSFGKRKQREQTKEFYEISQKLRHLTIFESHEDLLLPEALKFAISPTDVDRLYLKHKQTVVQQQQQIGGVSRRATFCGAVRGAPLD